MPSRLLWREVTASIPGRLHMRQANDPRLYRATLLREIWSKLKYRVWLIRHREDRPMT